MTHAVYNDNEPFAADWLEALIDHGHIAPGRVDRRSIADLTPADVAGAGQRHFFAGIGGWSAALRLAGVADDASVWTGSCPCQPFSEAGKGGGEGDARHLWPAWAPLIEQCRPPIIFGEQVASAAGLGWLDVVSADLERCGYAVGAADLCAASVGAPHIRQRLFFVAYADGEPGRLLLRQWRSRHAHAQAGRRGEDSGMAHPAGERRLGREGGVPPRSDEPDAPGRRPRGGMADSLGDRRQERGDAPPARRRPRPGVAATHGRGADGALADAGRNGARNRRATSRLDQGEREQGATDTPRRRRAGLLADRDREGLEVQREQQARRQRQTPQRGITVDGVPAGATSGFWHPTDWLLCRDPSGGAPVARPVEPGTFPLAHGVPERVGLLSGYGNAIVPQVAAAFIVASLDALSDRIG